MTKILMTTATCYLNDSRLLFFHSGPLSFNCKFINKKEKVFFASVCAV